jgi:hypothetical protein
MITMERIELTPAEIHEILFSIVADAADDPDGMRDFIRELAELTESPLYLKMAKLSEAALFAADISDTMMECVASMDAPLSMVHDAAHLTNLLMKLSDNAVNFILLCQCAQAAVEHADSLQEEE